MENFEKGLNDELKRRLETIESSNYKFPKQLNKMDYLFIIISIIICFIGIILGAFL